MKPVAPVEQEQRTLAVQDLIAKIKQDEKILAAIQPIADMHGLEGEFVALALLALREQYGDDVTSWPVNPLQ